MIRIASVSGSARQRVNRRCSSRPLASPPLREARGRPSLALPPYPDRIFNPFSRQEPPMPSHRTSLFTSESVSVGHPDKVADQISDAILDAMLEKDPNSRAAVETMVSTGMAVVAGEVKTEAYVEIPEVVRQT